MKKSIEQFKKFEISNTSEVVGGCTGQPTEHTVMTQTISTIPGILGNSS